MCSLPFRVLALRPFRVVGWLVTKFSCSIGHAIGGCASGIKSIKVATDYTPVRADLICGIR
ncbi:MAG: hypothetical protein QME51_04385 [Planctomycetota bacterium]|nr:hypothetical protein [Planctomycetota bacterium]MDI6787588.1 hypothetical protein [Planctomycetota bacterium]